MKSRGAMPGLARDLRRVVDARHAAPGEDTER